MIRLFSLLPVITGILLATDLSNSVHFSENNEQIHSRLVAEPLKKPATAGF
jgi:hypothetical protein